MSKKEKIVTIKKLNFIGKWVEFWFYEEPRIIYIEDGTVESDWDKWTECCESYMLQRVVDDADLNDEIFYNGWDSLIGKKIRWLNDRPIEIIKIK